MIKFLPEHYGPDNPYGPWKHSQEQMFRSGNTCFYTQGGSHRKPNNKYDYHFDVIKGECKKLFFLSQWETSRAFICGFHAMYLKKDQMERDVAKFLNKKWKTKDHKLADHYHFAKVIWRAGIDVYLIMKETYDANADDALAMWLQAARNPNGAEDAEHIRKFFPVDKQRMYFWSWYGRLQTLFTGFRIVFIPPAHEAWTTDGAPEQSGGDVE